MTEKVPARVAPESAFLVLAAALCTAVLTVLTLPGYWARPGIVAPAVFADLVLGLPLLGYLFLVRSGGRSPSLLLPLSLAGVLLANWWIPAGHLGFPVSLEAVAILIEGGVLLLLLIRGRRALARFRAVRGHVPYATDALRAALSHELGRRVGSAVFGEMAVLWYAVAGWKGRPRDNAPGLAFPGHRRSGYPAVLGAIILAVLVETAVVHLLVSLWLGWVAWLLTILGGYSILWLIGDFNAARLNPSVLASGQLHVRTGLRWHADVPLCDIVAVHDGSAPDGEAVSVSLWGDPNVWVESRSPVRIGGPFGIERQSRILGLGVDDPESFSRELREAAPVTPQS